MSEAICLSHLKDFGCEKQFEPGTFEGRNLDVRRNMNQAFGSRRRLAFGDGHYQQECNRKRPAAHIK